MSDSIAANVPLTAKLPHYAEHAIGEWTYGEPTILSWDSNTRLRIGKFCSIAADVTIILGGEHRVDWVTTYPFNAIFERAGSFEGHPSSKGDIQIGNDVWIGLGATILSGVTIGDGAVIGARSVVSRNVAPYAIVAGNPAIQRRLRFDQDVVEALQRIAWWDWPLDRIREAWPLLLSPDIRKFIARYGS
jgi:acetyltransferase-like isoleucine patch superfamily enzyme